MERLRPLGARWPWLGAALDVQQRFGELNGGPIAAAVTLAAFLSLFPLVLAVIGVVGIFSSSGNDLAGALIRNLGLSGDAARTLRSAIETAERSDRTASIVGFVGMLWAGLGLVAALQYAIDRVWQVTGRGLKDKVYALVWLVGAGALFLGSFGLGTLLNFLPGWMAPLSILIGLVVNVVLFWWTFFLLGHHDVGWRPLLPGALLAGAGFEILKVIGTVYVPRQVASSSALYGSIGTVFAVLGWMVLLGRLIVYASVLNVVRYERASGTVTLEVQAPRLPGEVPLTATRAGAVAERASASLVEEAGSRD